jgi:hypothetical protein
VVIWLLPLTAIAGIGSGSGLSLVVSKLFLWQFWAPLFVILGMTTVQVVVQVVGLGALRLLHLDLIKPMGGIVRAPPMVQGKLLIILSEGALGRNLVHLLPEGVVRAGGLVGQEGVRVLVALRGYHFIQLR